MGTSKVKMRLQGHEKFALRDGWLNKGIRIVADEADIFQSDRGPDVFGIGNNMVKSVRYWLRAFGLISETPGKGAVLTDMGKLIAAYDLYFEDTFTLWVLHSYISKNVEEATTWYMFFNRCAIEDLEKEQVVNVLNREITKYAEGNAFSENSLKSDVDVLLNMYSKSKEVSDPEDKNISPFTDLKLLKKVDGRYTKTQPDRWVINEWNVLYELAIILDGKSSISIEDAATGDNGIASIYQLSSVMINEYLDKLDAIGYIHVDRTAGLDIIYKSKEFTALDIMEEYYKKNR